MKYNSLFSYTLRRPGESIMCVYSFLLLLFVCFDFVNVLAYRACSCSFSKGSFR